jgi:hypothetical protein
MADSLSKEAVYLYFELTQLSYNRGLIRFMDWVSRQLALRLMCAPDDTLKDVIDRELHIDDKSKLENDWQDVGDSPKGKQQNQSERNESVIDVVQDGDGGPLSRLTPSGSTGLSRWVFHQYDPDPFPSIPHGHHNGQSQPKLDAYLGWVYLNATRNRREPRRNIVALWNDDKFRDFARQAIQYYLTHHPHYRWRVSNPGRIPAKRKH